MSESGIRCTDERNSQQVEMEIGAKKPYQQCSKTIQAFTHPNMGIGYSIIDFKSLKEKYSQLYPLPDHKLHFADVKMIVGPDLYQLMRPTENKLGQRNEAWVVKTALGWTLSGPMPKNFANTISATAQFSQADEMLTEQVKKRWEMEAYASNCKTSGCSEEDNKAIETLQRTATFDGERYEVGMLWNVNPRHLPNNFFQQWVS